ncbi:MAG: hypothetical protein JWM88_197 [Verrucomicrobia bacterium]|nr:hypothetical protein [Verrucomicrobiota bacterium]
MPPVRLVNLKKNEAALTDPTPLFLPTEWNAGQDPLESSGRREPGTSFTGYPAKLKFAETDLALTFPSDVVVPARPADALADGKLGQTFLGLDGGGSEPARLPGRRGFVEITETSNGQRVLAQPLTDAEPPAAGWQPMEFLVAVDAMGIVGPPILTESSRNAAVDGYFQNYLVKTLHAGERLAPGFYRICVGP